MYTLKKSYGEILTKLFSKILTTSKRKRLKTESDRGKEWYNSIFQSFLTGKTTQNYSRYPDKDLVQLKKPLKLHVIF